MGLSLGAASARRAYERIQQLTLTGIADSEFLAKLSGLLREIIPFNACFWAAADPLTMLATSPSRLENLGSGEACDRYWESEFFVEDVNHFRMLARMTSPAATLYRVTEGHPRRSSRYHNLNLSLGLGDELRCVFRTGVDVWGYACLWRAEDAQPFTPGEEQLLAGLADAIGHTFRRSALLRPGLAMNMPDAPGLLIFDQTGELETLNEPAEAWLREFTPLRYDNPDIIPLPSELRSVANKARAIAAGRDRGNARARLLIRGYWVVIHGFALRETNAGSGRTALVIEPATATEVAALIVKAYQLSRREQQIVRLVANGLPTTDIAAMLRLSTHTIRDYLKQIFEKVEVSSRGELVAKIFAEHYKPTLDPDIHVDP
ncbi:LuxR C-terminal-related transcriptional regulator [Nonomuraea purpurea]|uniref:LuxR C-terminal-related transcriptional regulator n=1 Tax=Nonomuraea purpurea TaxID=1849276 RepID=A0ABV8GDV4_9ACTN